MTAKDQKKFPVPHEDRHPAVLEAHRWFAYDHLPDGIVRDTSKRCAALADEMMEHLPDCAQLTIALHKLVEAKDAFVRTAVYAREDGD